ncbi:MAG: hypothetical protein WCE38_05550 [Burkholderiales bacterium]
MLSLPPRIAGAGDIDGERYLRGENPANLPASNEAQNAVVLWLAATTTSLGLDSVPQIIDQFVQLLITTMTQGGVI